MKPSHAPKIFFRAHVHRVAGTHLRNMEHTDITQAQTKEAILLMEKLADSEAKTEATLIKVEALESNSAAA